MVGKIRGVKIVDAAPVEHGPVVPQPVDTDAPQDPQAVLDQLRTANDALAAKVHLLETRFSMSTEQFTALRAEIKRAVDLGKT